MANPQKGEVTFEALGKVQTLRLTTNAICILEADLDMGILEIGRMLDSGKLTIVRAAFRAGLANGNGTGELTLTEAGEIIDEIGYADAAKHLTKALELCFPPQEEGEAARPPQAGASIRKRA